MIYTHFYTEHYQTRGVPLAEGSVQRKPRETSCNTVTMCQVRDALAEIARKTAQEPIVPQSQETLKHPFSNAETNQKHSQDKGYEQIK